MKQMVIDERNRIEFLVGCGRNVPQVAKELGRNPSTIRNELLKHRIDSDKRYGCSNRIFARFDECARKVFTGFAERLGKNTPKCYRTCPEFSSGRRSAAASPGRRSSATGARRSASAR